MSYTVAQIAAILRAEPVPDERVITQLLIDSRKLIIPTTTIFFALRTSRRSGMFFIDELYNRGVRAFVVDEKPDASAYPNASFILVENTLQALQHIATHHRMQFTIPIIGITGSNGKTIVKEWLFQILHTKENIVRSPKSYNSQIGVPLSVWELNDQATLGIFEAGISTVDEMGALNKMILPTVGVLTTIGDAHNEGFTSAEQKFSEKIKLFTGAGIVVMKGSLYSQFKGIVDKELGASNLFTWGYKEDNDLVIITSELEASQTFISYVYKGEKGKFSIPFTDEASIENAISCFVTVISMGYNIQDMEASMALLQPVNMRLEVKKGINNCILINDSYSADKSSLQIALNFLLRQPRQKFSVIISNFLQTGEDETNLFHSVFHMFLQQHITKVILIGAYGDHVFLHKEHLNVEHYNTTDDFLNQAKTSSFKDEAILIKGARTFSFERIANFLEDKVHQTVLEINLTSLIHNLKEFQKHLHPRTKVMAMVKAFAYGSGAVDVAAMLQFHKVDFLGVAYADEGVELRKAGIVLPIMVMNPEVSAFDQIVTYNLQPDIFSFNLLRQFDAFLKNENITQYPIHLEVETGMNRLGFSINEMEVLGAYLQDSPSFYVVSVFTHLAASEDPVLDSFSQLQYERFTSAISTLEQFISYPFIKHIANSAASIRNPLFQMDMVRLGIGLYGVNNSNEPSLQLLPVVTFKSTIAQLKVVKAGETVSYNRKGLVQKDSCIATIRVGYADGYPRRLGNGIGSVFIHGVTAPIIGTICMDMLMVDVTHIPQAKEGDEVVIFGKEPTVEQVANWASTIPYEILTGISQRVKRVYYEE